MLTKDMLIDKYKNYDPDVLVDELNISSEELLDRFEDKLYTILENENSEDSDSDDEYGEVM